MKNNDVRSQIDQEKKRSNRTLIVLSVALILIALAVALYWGLTLRNKESTTDAYVNGNRIVITPQIAGMIKAIHFDNTDYVAKGDVLVELDETINQLAYEKAKNSLAEAVRSVAQTFIQDQRLQADIEKRQIEVHLAQAEYQRRVELVEIGAVSQEEFAHAKASFQKAQLSFKETRFALQEIKALIQNTTIATHPYVRKMADQVREAYLSLQKCQVRSPVSGYIAQKTAQLGAAVSFGQPLLEVIPLNEIWVDANYKETQISRIQIGQKVKMTSDLYGKEVIYHGEVEGIEPGTGAVFSLLPPQNATGNWIKIVQRVPVRIRLDPLQLAKDPLWLGLSMNVTIDVQGPTQHFLKEPTHIRAIYQTNVYEEQKEEVETIIQEIIQTNVEQV